METNRAKRLHHRERVKAAAAIILISVAAAACIFFTVNAGRTTTPKVHGIQHMVQTKSGKLTESGHVSGIDASRVRLVLFRKTPNGKAKMVKRVRLHKDGIFSFSEALPDKTYSTYMLKTEFPAGTYRAKIMQRLLKEKLKSTSEVIHVVRRNIAPADIACKSACIYDGKNVIFGANETEELPNASTTKLMTAYLLMGCTEKTDNIPITDHAAAVAYQELMAKGRTFSQEDILKAMLLISSNDAATAAGDYIAKLKGNSIENVMNSTAANMGLTHTQFQNACGLDEPSHYSCALDLCKICQKCRTYKEFRDVESLQACKIYSQKKTIQVTKAVKKGKKTVRKTAMKTLKPHKYLLTTTNELLKEKIPGYLGGKTGTTTNAGACLTSAYRYQGHVYYITVLNSQNRFEDTKALMQYIRDYAGKEAQA